MGLFMDGVRHVWVGLRLVVEMDSAGHGRCWGWVSWPLEILRLDGVVMGDIRQEWVGVRQ